MGSKLGGKSQKKNNSRKSSIVLNVVSDMSFKMEVGTSLGNGLWTKYSAMNNFKENRKVGENNYSYIINAVFAMLEDEEYYVKFLSIPQSQGEIASVKIKTRLIYKKGDEDSKNIIVDKSSQIKNEMTYFGFIEENQMEMVK